MYDLSSRVLGRYSNQQPHSHPILAETGSMWENQVIKHGTQVEQNAYISAVASVQEPLQEIHQDIDPPAEVSSCKDFKI